MSGCQMVCISNGCLKNGQKMSVLWSKMSGIQMVRLIKPLENWTKKCLKSQMLGFQVSAIQMITVKALSVLILS